MRVAGGLTRPRANPMNSVACRRPVATEAKALCAFVRQAIAAGFPMFTAEAVESYLKPWTPDDVAARLQHGRDILIAALAGDEIVGVISGTAPEGGVGTVIWLLVDARWRGRNVGRALYDAACLAYCRLGAHKMKLTAPSESAKRFYERCGMHVEGFHPDHWYKLDFYSLGVLLDPPPGGLERRHRITVDHPVSTEREP